ncbi:MAG: BCAM0308 family protein [Burkholderiales bacterium]
MKKGQSRDRQPQRIERSPIEEAQHDPYRPKTKLPEPSVCPQCALVYHGGRWLETARPQQAAEQLCPACRRIHDRFPAGYVTLEGAFLAQHRDEILHIARNTETRERSRHPLQRIMDVEQTAERIEVTTTDLHLARRIGEAVHSAFEGTLDVNYSPNEYVVRVHWTR